MTDQLESALVLALRETIKWESASEGTLAPIDPDEALNPLDYQGRDRVLAFRDLLVGAAVVEASIQVSDVYNYETIRPGMQGMVALSDFTFAGSLAGNLDSQVRHVGQTSIPYDAARYADADLYGRDALLYEILARACKEAFESSPLTDIDDAGTVIPNTAIWSLAEGTANRSDINAALSLNRDLFKNPDMNLADRDNLIAAYVSRMVKILANPFEHAHRLYVQTTVSGKVEREPDIYALFSDDGTYRTFRTEPSMDRANTIVYGILDHKLQWFREQSDEIHVPQIYALEIPGIDSGQVIQTVAAVPETKDAQFWRSKAALINAHGTVVQDEYLIDTTNTSVTSGGFDQIDCVSLNVPGQVSFEFPALPVGPKMVNLLVKPNPIVEVPGQANLNDIIDTQGGASFECNVASGDIRLLTYLVEGGDGVVYDSVTYLPGATFSGKTGVTTYSQAGAIESTVRQYAMSYKLALPPGTWTLEFEYADKLGVTDGFGVRAQMAALGSLPVDVCSDMIALTSTGVDALSVSKSTKNMFQVLDANQFTLNFLWTYGTGQLQIYKIILTGELDEGRFFLSGSYQDSLAYAEFAGQSFQTEVVRFPVQATSEASGTFLLTAGTYAELPLQILEVDVQSRVEHLPSLLSRSFPGWKQECLDRAARVVEQGYARTLAAFTSAGSEIPSFRDSGSYWSENSTEAWMAFTEIYNPRLRELLDVEEIVVGRQYEATTTPTIYAGGTYSEGDKFYGVDGTTTFTGSADQVGAFIKARPGHVGKPCLLPYGVYVEDSGTKAVKAYWDTSISRPFIETCQPWMIAQGFYVAQHEFWTPDTL